MKIAAISDLHLDINRDYPVLEALRDEVEESGASYLLVYIYLIDRCLADSRKSLEK